MGFFQRHRDNDAFAGRQPVGFDDDRRPLLVDKGMRGGAIGEAGKIRCGDVMTDHETLGKILRAFKLGRFTRRSEYLQPASTEDVDDAGRQRGLRTDDGQMNAFLFREIGQCLRFGDMDVHDFGFTCRAGVARRDENTLNAGEFGQVPSQRMLAPAGAYDE